MSHNKSGTKRSQVGRETPTLAFTTSHIVTVGTRGAIASSTVAAISTDAATTITHASQDSTSHRDLVSTMKWGHL